MTANAYDDIKICSAALNLIGEKPINSIDDPKTDNEATCARIYPLVVSELLSSHEWNFANPVRQLAINADQTPQFGYEYAHRLPSDLIAGPFAVYGDGNFRYTISDYENADDHIHSNYERIDVRYRKKTAVSTWPEYFVSLVVLALASRLAKPVADNTSLTQELRIQAFGPAEANGQGGFLKVAKGIDAKSQPIRSFFRNGDPLTATRC